MLGGAFSVASRTARAVSSPPAARTRRDSSMASYIDSAVRDTASRIPPVAR